MHGAADPSTAHRTHDANTNAVWFVPHIHPQRMRLGVPALRCCTLVSDVGGMKACMVRLIRAGRSAHTVLTQTPPGSSLISAHSASDWGLQHRVGVQR